MFRSSFSFPFSTVMQGRREVSSFLLSFSAGRQESQEGRSPSFLPPLPLSLIISFPSLHNEILLCPLLFFLSLPHPPASSAATSSRASGLLCAAQLMKFPADGAKLRSLFSQTFLVLPPPPFPSFLFVRKRYRFFPFSRTINSRPGSPLPHETLISISAS